MVSTMWFCVNCFDSVSSASSFLQIVGCGIVVKGVGIWNLEVCWSINELFFWKYPCTEVEYVSEF